MPPVWWHCMTERADFDFSASPVAWRYTQDRAAFQCIMGPVGSGKTLSSIVRVLGVGQDQVASPPNERGRRIRRTRGCIVRNTMPELKSTTMDTYERVYPPQYLGPIIHRAPANHVIRRGDLEIDVLFIALDTVADVKKLLSLEVTWFFINEGREIPRGVINRLNERIGRYGIEERDTTWSGVWMDTNAPDADHWLYTLDMQDRPSGWEFYHQAPGVLEVVEQPDGSAKVIDKSFPMLVDDVWRTAVVAGVEHVCEIIHAGDRSWIVNPKAENLPALWRVNKSASPLGAESYYGRALAGKPIEQVQSYLQGVYCFVTEGRPVIPNYHPETHSRERITPLDGVELILAADIGGGTLQPSAIVLQRHPRGSILALSEVVCTDATGIGRMGLKRFGEVLARHLQEYYPVHLRDGLIGEMWADPAGVGKDEIFEVAAFDYLRSEFGWDVQPAPTQDPDMRVQAIVGPCGRLGEAGIPGFLVSRKGCPMLHKGLSGAWTYKRIRVAGDERYADKPTKNDYSHPCDAAGYGLLGMGEYSEISARGRNDWSGTKHAGNLAGWPT